MRLKRDGSRYSRNLYHKYSGVEIVKKENSLDNQKLIKTNNYLYMNIGNSY